MPTQPAARFPTMTDSLAPISGVTGSALVATAVAHLAEAIQADAKTNAGKFAPWAVTSLAEKLGLRVAVSESRDPVDVVLDLGVALQDVICQALDDRDSRDYVLIAVSVVVDQVMTAVRRRLAT